MYRVKKNDRYRHHVHVNLIHLALILQPKNEPLRSDNYLHSALSSVLTPLVRFLLQQGFTYPSLILLLRKIYVDLAEHAGTTQNKPPTTSRISLLTGIARRYVREIRQPGNSELSKPLKMPPTAKLIALWTSQPKFQDADSQPLRLPRLAANTPDVSFEALATLASKDIRPRTQLDSLIERGLVSLDDEDQVELLSQAYLPDTDKEEMLSVMGQHLRDHISAATGNINNGDCDGANTELDRSAYQEGLSAASVAELKALSEKEGMKVLQKIYARANELATKDEGNHQYRFRLGLYTYSENTNKSQNDPSQD